jgi:hypothetical protein
VVLARPWSSLYLMRAVGRASLDRVLLTQLEMKRRVRLSEIKCLAQEQPEQVCGIKQLSSAFRSTHVEGNVSYPIRKSTVILEEECVARLTIRGQSSSLISWPLWETPREPGNQALKFPRNA